MKKIFLMAGLLAVSMSAIGGDKGNGGDAVVCGDKVFLLDRIEAEESRENGGREFILNVDGATVTEKVETILQRLKKVDVLRYEIISKYANEILVALENLETTGLQSNETVLFTRNTLADIDDSFELMIPEGCSKEQLVVQREAATEFDHPARYVIRKDLWEKMDTLDQAMTIIHESIYRLAIEGRAYDSRFTRLMNEFLASDKALNEGIKGYVNIMSYAAKLKGGIRYTVKIKHSDNKIYEFPFDLSSLVENENGFSMKLTKLTNGSWFGASDEKYSYYPGVWISEGLNVSARGSLAEVKFSKDGEISQYVLYSNPIAYNVSNGQTGYSAVSGPRHTIKTTAYANGVVEVLNLSKSFKMKAKVDGVKYKNVSKITFAEKNKITEIQ